MIDCILDRIKHPSEERITDNASVKLVPKSFAHCDSQVMQCDFSKFQYIFRYLYSVEKIL